MAGRKSYMESKQSSRAPQLCLSSSAAVRSYCLLPKSFFTALANTVSKVFLKAYSRWQLACAVDSLLLACSVR